MCELDNLQGWVSQASNPFHAEPGQFLDQRRIETRLKILLHPLRVRDLPHGWDNAVNRDAGAEPHRRGAHKAFGKEPLIGKIEWEKDAFY
jgi:hypothetical protein